MNTVSPLTRRHSITPVLATLAALSLALILACTDDVPDSTGEPPTSTSTEEEQGGSPTAATIEPSSPPDTATATETTTATATVTAAPPPGDPSARLRDLLVSGLAADTGAAQETLAGVEVLVQAIPAADRDLWLAVSSGSAIYDVPSGDARHEAGIYERVGGETLVEVARLPLESGPTETVAVEVLPIHGSDGLPVWVALHGVTGAHSGTFELLRFDGLSLTSALWWFSPSPAAASTADLDGDGLPEVVLDASDPYVFCYACGVSAPAEIVYRWEQMEPVAVNIAPVPGDATVSALTEAAVAYVEADLWREAREAITDAAEAAPDDPDVRWLRIVIDRTAEARLAQAGSEAQPLVTYVLAGEYAAAAGLMRSLDPAEVFDPAGPLLAGTSAEGFETVAGDYLVDYATRALAVHPDLAAAYAVRALGRVISEGAVSDEAVTDMGQAALLSSGDGFYAAALAYLAAEAD